MSVDCTTKLTLPLVSSNEPQAPTWNGWTPLAVLEAPEPGEPQGAYSDSAPEAPLDVPAVEHGGLRKVELLAPAGGVDAAFAAFHFGADAIYLGLKKFSARAEAENFTLEEVDEITAYAHSLLPRRRVFVTVNTLIRQDEVAELIEAVAALAAIGVDAVIVQDLGVYHLIRRHFPDLELHASTQLSIHNRAGAEMLHRLGFRRGVLARELTFEEVRDITATTGIETEVFIHGALCYAYSGLCLFSSQTLGRSGNRGKCAYSCRDSYEVSDAPLTLRDGSPVKRDPRAGFPFSMKDLALPDHIPALRAAGVSCFKIEGRKKSPLYVATTTDYYRKLVGGGLSAEERPIHEADMQTVFSRPWTRLFVQSHKDKEVADRDTVGHRGTLIGEVEAVLAPGSVDARLRFRTKRALERHDGLQVDLPIVGKPFGFAVDRLWTVGPKGKRSEEFQAAAGTLVEIGLPVDHPEIPAGAPVYCSSSQVVKQRYRHERPKPGQYRVRETVNVEVVLTREACVVTATSSRKAGEPVESRQSLPGPFSLARDPQAMERAARGAFEKLGQTRLQLASFTLRNDKGLFVPVSRLNQLRRDLATDLEAKLQCALQLRVAQLRADLCPKRDGPVPSTGFQWSIKVDRIGFLDALEDADLAGVEEVIVDIAREHPALLHEKLEIWAARLGRERIRLALPALTRSWEEKGLRHKIAQLRDAGWTNWEAANLSAWNYLDLPASGGRQPPDVPRNQGADAPRSLGLDLATDWSIYVINRLSASQLLDMGVTRFTLSPEDGLENLRSLLAEFADRAVVIIHQDTPQFLAESCAYANLIGGCPGKASCRFESMDMVSSHGEKVTALDYHCRTIVLNQGPFCLSSRLADLKRAGAIHLRADFIFRKYDPSEVRDRWRRLRAGQSIPGGHAANFDRGIQ
jgi:putative protease